MARPMKLWMDTAVSPAAAEADAFIGRFTQGRWLFPFFTLLIATVETLGKPPYWTWAIAVSAGLGLVGYVSIWHYQRHRQSARALFFMMNGMSLSLGLLLPGMIEEEARVFAKNYWLYRDYFYLYVAFFVAASLFVALMKRWRAQDAKEQMEMLAAYAERGTVSASELFDVLTQIRGAKEAFRNWVPARFAAIIGPFTVAAIAAGAWGGGDYILYLCFLGAVAASPVLVGLSLRRTVELHRYLGSRDIVIYGLTPTVPTTTRLKNRVIENYRSMGRIAKTGVYVELVVFLAFGALVNMGEKTPWGIVVTLGVWLCGFMLILLDNKQADFRLRSGQIGWMIVHVPLIFAFIDFVFSTFK